MEQAERIAVTGHDKAPGTGSRYDELVARGVIRPAASGLTAGDWREFTHIDVPDDVDPLAVLLAAREHER